MGAIIRHAYHDTSALPQRRLSETHAGATGWILASAASRSHQRRFSDEQGQFADRSGHACNRAYQKTETPSGLDAEGGMPGLLGGWCSNRGGGFRLYGLVSMIVCLGAPFCRAGRCQLGFSLDRFSRLRRLNLFLGSSRGRRGQLGSRCRG